MTFFRPWETGANLADKDVLGIVFVFYPKLSDKRIGTYYLNGLDDEEEIYKQLESMLVSKK